MKTDGGYLIKNLTIRGHFAGLAMQGMLAFPGTVGDENAEEKTPAVIAHVAVIYADALIAELNKNER